MGCTGDREKGPPEYTQKWDFINLSDFKATSAFSSIAYIWVWFMALVAVAVYAADTFTAVNLLAFDKWSSTVEPSIPFKYSKWIFTACIMFSWALLMYEWLRAIRVIKRGGVAESYMDPLAVNVQSMRGKGWRRFLVFTELTKSKKGVDYVAFLVYFAFNGAVRVILAEGPRQFVNAVTLYAVMQAKIEVHGSPSTGHSSVEQFFLNIQTLANENVRQAVILASMLFTLVIWVFSALKLIIALALYLIFLWHYIPQADGRLSIYCRRKIDKRLEKIVAHKIKAAREEEQRQRQKSERKAELKHQKSKDLPQKPQLARQPTLPQLEDDLDKKAADVPPPVPLSRQESNMTTATLPPYSSRPPTRNGTVQRQPTATDLAETRPAMLSRMGTQASEWSHDSYESDAPLLRNAGYAGEGGRGTPVPGLPTPSFNRQDSNASFNRPAPSRTVTQGSQYSQRSRTPMSRMDSTLSRQTPFSPMSQGSYPTGPSSSRVPPLRSNTGFSFQEAAQSPYDPTISQAPYERSTGTPSQQNTQDSFSVGPLRNASSSPSYRGATPAEGRRPNYGSLSSQQSSFSRPMAASRKPSETSPDRAFSPLSSSRAPAVTDSFEMVSQPSHDSYATRPPLSSNPSGYVAFNPSFTPIAQRNITVTGTAGVANSYFGNVLEVPQRSVTAPIDSNRFTTGYGDIVDSYGDSARNSVLPPNEEQPLGPPQRSYTAGPVMDPPRNIHWHGSTRF